MYRYFYILLILMFLGLTNIFDIQYFACGKLKINVIYLNYFLCYYFMPDNSKFSQPCSVQCKTVLLGWYFYHIITP